MCIILTVEYRAQIIADIISGLSREESSKASAEFDNAVAASLQEYNSVKLNPYYKRYGLDIGLVSENKSELNDACREIALHTRTNPSLKDIEFESFSNVSPE